MTFNHCHQHFRLVSHHFGFCGYKWFEILINYFPFSPKWLCVPKVMILSHSFVQRLSGDLEQHFDDRAKSNFNLEDVKVRVFGVGGRTVNKIEPFDLMSPFFAPDFVISEIGTNDLCNKPPEMVGSQIDKLVVLSLNHFSVGVVGVCQVIKKAEPTFNKVQVLNLYLSVVVERPEVFVWQHKILDSPSLDFLLEDGVHLNPCGQYLVYRSYQGAILKAVNILNKFEWIMLMSNTLCW